MFVALVSVGLGLFGVAGAGLLSLAAGALAFRPRPVFGREPRGQLAVLIPAHNEESVLRETILGIQAALKRAGLQATIFVGADSCSDASGEIARELGARVEKVEYRSKWLTLNRLAQISTGSSWVALVDAGSLWPERLIENIRPFFLDDSVLGVAPAYLPQKASSFERHLWGLEARWKNFENLAGGPVSAHGATVFYRGEVLARCLAFLSESSNKTWLNDDVVIPLSARALFPGARFLYWCPTEQSERISDAGLREHDAEFGRRRRLLLGNLQWVSHLWLPLAASSPIAALLAVRRALRILWAYWALLILYGLCAALGLTPGRSAILAGLLAAFGALVLFLTGKRGILEAWIVSLLAPFYIRAAAKAEAHVWK